MAGLTPPAAGDPDIGTFLARITHLDPQALVRVRSVGPGRAELWARVPWDVLVTRTVAWPEPNELDSPAWLDPSEPGALDVTVSAAAWLSAPEGRLAGLPRQDARWRTPLPVAGGTVVVLEAIPTAQVRAIAAAAAATLRATSEQGVAGRPIGERAIRDALLDHVPIVVMSHNERIDVPQRLVQAIARMNFLGEDSDMAQVIRIGRWIGVSAAYGVAWWRGQSALPVHSRRS